MTQQLPDPSPFAKAYQKDGYDRLHMEAALCIWEDLIAHFDNARRMEKAGEERGKWLTDLMEAWESVGWSSMRQSTIDLASHALALYDALSEDETETFGSYDWEFIPFFVEQVNWGDWSAMVPSQMELTAAAKDWVQVEKMRRAVLNGLPSNPVSIAP